MTDLRGAEAPQRTMRSGELPKGNSQNRSHQMTRRRTIARWCRSIPWYRWVCALLSFR